MKHLLIVLILTNLLTPEIVEGRENTPSGTTKQWNYSGSAGPGHWGELSQEYRDCSSGNNQSPVNLTLAARNQLDPIEFRYQSSKVTLLNNGHTIQLTNSSGSSIKVGGDVFTLVQAHFHSQSEHQIEGTYSDLELHLVHQNQEGALAVIGILINEGAEQEEFAKFWDQLPQKEGDRIDLEINVDFGAILPKEQSFYYYMGSLTTPPCSEGVRWFVLKNSITVSEGQLAAFNRLFFNNYRPIQSLNRRHIFQSN